MRKRLITAVTLIGAFLFMLCQLTTIKASMYINTLQPLSWGRSFTGYIQGDKAKEVRDKDKRKFPANTDVLPEGCKGLKKVVQPQKDGSYIISCEEGSCKKGYDCEMWSYTPHTDEEKRKAEKEKKVLEEPTWIHNTTKKFGLDKSGYDYVKKHNIVYGCFCLKSKG